MLMFFKLYFLHVHNSYKLCEQNEEADLSDSHKLAIKLSCHKIGSEFEAWIEQN